MTKKALKANADEKKKMAEIAPDVFETTKL